MRAVRPLLITLAILAVLFVAADRIAVAVAENESASKLQDSQNISSKPDVSIKGFPFLTQVLGGKLHDVHASAEGIEAGNGAATVRISRFSANLHDVRLSNGFSTAVADSASGTALINYADLSKSAPEGVSVAYGGKNAEGKDQLKVSGKLELLGQTWERSVNSTIDLKGDTVSLHAGSIPGTDGIPGLEDLVRDQVDFSQKISGLPSGIELKSVRPGPDGVTIELTGNDVDITG